MKRAALHNLGCKVNAYELDIMQQNLQEKGYTIVSFDEMADIYIVNTCTVTNIADRKSRQMLHQAKKRNPEAVVVAVGCYVQTADEEALREQGIDLAIGNNRKKDLIPILEKFLAEHKQEEDAIIDVNAPCDYEEMTLKHTAEHTRAYIKIQDGCNQFCSYCIIPYARGRVRSRRYEDIRREMEGLAQSGYKEVVLTGIMTEKNVKRLASIEKLCPHFHLSLQSGCDETLRRMNRHYTTGEYLEGTKRLREAFAHPAITTDVIVGFPGETEEEFAKTCGFLREADLYEMHIFKYSKRKGTVAAGMPDQIPGPVQTKRSAELLAMEKELSKRYREYYIGKEIPVLFEEEKEIGGIRYQMGHSREYVKVAKKTEENLSNRILSGKIVDFLQEDILLMQ